MSRLEEAYVVCLIKDGNIMQKFIDNLTRYFAEKENTDIEIYYFDVEKIIFNDIKINKKFVIKNSTFNDLIGRRFERYFDNSFSYLNIDKVEDYLRDYSRLNGYLADNSNLEIYSDYGFYQQSYAEFIIIKRDYHLDLDKLAEFFIEDIRIEISNPSEMLTMIFKSIEEMQEFWSWKSYKSIKLFNIKKDNIERYLQQVLFLLEFYMPWYFQLGPKSSYTKEFDNDILEAIKSPQVSIFQSARFIEPIIFYNEAIKRYYINLEDETSFLYLYKVIEYFFLINRKNEISVIIQENINNIDEIILKMQNIYKTEEKICLSYIVNNESIKPKITKLISRAYKDKLISGESYDAFVDAVYSFRNSIAHGKGDKGYTLKLPNILKQDIELICWNSLMKDFALICINEFCYDESL